MPKFVSGRTTKMLARDPSALFMNGQITPWTGEIPWFNRCYITKTVATIIQLTWNLFRRTHYAEKSFEPLWSCTEWKHCVYVSRTHLGQAFGRVCYESYLKPCVQLKQAFFEKRLIRISFEPEIEHDHAYISSSYIKLTTLLYSNLAGSMPGFHDNRMLSMYLSW